MMIDPAFRQGTLCQTYGHNWRATNVPGKHVCSNCKELAYCRGCVLIVPNGVTIIRCEKQ